MVRQGFFILFFISEGLNLDLECQHPSLLSLCQHPKIIYLTFDIWHLLMFILIK